MEIPDKIKVGAYYFKVYFEKNLSRSRDRFGEFRPSPQEIALDPDCTEDLQGETLLHEVVEALNWMYDMQLNHHIIALLGTGLHQILKENDLKIKAGDADGRQAEQRNAERPQASSK